MENTITLKQFMEQLNEKTTKEPDLLDCNLLHINSFPHDYTIITVEGKDGRLIDLYIKVVEK